jgi:hypothetical protein
LDVITLDPATRRDVSGLLEGHIILPNGCVVGYRVDKGTIRRVHLGYAMGNVKEEDSTVDWDWKGMMRALE